MHVQNSTVSFFGAHSIKDIKLIGKTNAAYGLLSLHCHNDNHRLHLNLRKQLNFLQEQSNLALYHKVIVVKLISAFQMRFE